MAFTLEKCDMIKLEQSCCFLFLFFINYLEIFKRNFFKNCGKIIMIENQQKPSIEDILETLYAARDVCIIYEKKYKMLSEQFYELYSQGLLDDDGLNFDFVDWAGSYKTFLEFQQEYNNHSKKSTIPEKLARLKSQSYAVVS